jgi:thiosulfate/3-mercaptopyruvate sulfurtransferase
MSRLLINLIAFVFLLVSQAVIACVDEPDVARGWVTPEWLEEHVNHEDLIVVDVSFLKEDYEKEHIPNSVYVDWRRDLADQREDKYYRVPPKEAFQEVMSRIGAAHDKVLLFYDNKQNRLAIRAAWVATYYGHKHAAILEGGLGAWKSAGFKTTAARPQVTPSQYKIHDMHPEMNVEKDFVLENLRNDSVLLVDSRPRRMYTGEIPGKIIHTGQEVSRRGHIPGAVNIPWKSNMDHNSLFLSKEALLELYAEHGVTKDKLVIFYCNEGLHAAFNWFVATKILGFENVKIYEGSMGEWADDPMLPMVTGIGF